MKSMAIGGICALSLGLCACAATPQRAGLAHQRSMDDSLDVVKVVSVNQWASTRGATVIWLNYPTRNVHAKPTDG